jgi:peptidoglycan/xylan/chitin deacetylase (PgdA/CDA1 family)
MGSTAQGPSTRPGDDVLVRRGAVCAWEAGPRPLAPATGPLRWVRPAILGITSIACVRTDDRVLALTYDDGPDPEHTPEVLQALAAHGARATFFVLLDRARRYPTLLQRILAQGHEVALHGVDHTRLSDLPAREALRRIRRGRQGLGEILGAPVRLYRPAYGAQSVGQLLGCRAAGLDLVLWSAWARDWEEAPATQVAERALAAVHPGAFLLLHDATGEGDDQTGAPEVSFSRGEVTELLLAGLVERGYTTATVSEALGRYPAVRTLWAERASRGA